MVIEGVNQSANVNGTMNVPNTAAAPAQTSKAGENMEVSVPKQNDEVRKNNNGSVVIKENTEENNKTKAEEKEPAKMSEKVSNEQLKKAVEELNKKFGNSEAVFGIHDETRRVMIKIIDKDTKETIKEYPPEKTLDMIAKVWEMAGILVDEKL